MLRKIQWIPDPKIFVDSNDLLLVANSFESIQEYLTMGGDAWVVDLLCPILGTVLADVMWIVSINAILQARKNKSLGELNPLPFVAGLANCIVWVIYSVFIKDYFVFFANFPGVILCMFYTVSSMSLLAKYSNEKNDKMYAYVEGLFMFTISFYTILALIVGIIVTNVGFGSTFVGSIAMGVNIIYYASPCSVLMNVWKTRDATSLFLPLLLANLATALCWFFYSLIALNDVFIYGPNIIGIFLSCITISTKLYLGDKPVDNTNKSPLLDSYN